MNDIKNMWSQSIILLFVHEFFGFEMMIPQPTIMLAGHYYSPFEAQVESLL